MTSKSPVPADNGGRQRLVHLIGALGTLGTVDLVVGAPLDPSERELASALVTGEVHDAPAAPRRAFGRIRALASRTLPVSLAVTDHDAARHHLAGRLRGPHDLAWYSGATALWAHGDLAAGAPTMVDLADVTAVIERRARAIDRSRRRRLRPADLRQRVRRRLDAARWARFERSMAARANLVAVCSEADRDAIGVRALVVPNGYVRPSEPVGRVTVSGHPRLVFPGQLTYGPNVDAACWFVDEIWPIVLEREPQATFELAGRASAEVAALGARRGVEVTGYVDDMAAALARSDLVVVPLRQGSGTRIKILEAFAHRLPVVSTRVGAEGLGVRGGDELLLADDPESFADACVRALRDGAMRVALVEHAARTFAASFEWEGIERRFVDDVVASLGLATTVERA